MAPCPMVKLSIALIEHADMETAQAALQSALDTRHPPVVAVVSLGLGTCSPATEMPKLLALPSSERSILGIPI